MNEVEDKMSMCWIWMKRKGVGTSVIIIHWKTLKRSKKKEMRRTCNYFLRENCAFNFSNMDKFWFCPHNAQLSIYFMILKLFSSTSQLNIGHKMSFTHDPILSSMWPINFKYRTKSLIES